MQYLVATLTFHLLLLFFSSPILFSSVICSLSLPYPVLLTPLAPKDSSLLSLPRRLLDMEVESKTTGDKVPVLLRTGGNPYSFYSVLNSVKNDLIWGPTSNDDDDNENSASTTNNTRWSDPVAVSSAASTASSSSSSSGHVKGHMRRQSTLSMISVSSNASDGDSEGGCDGSEGGDSGVEAEDMAPELTAAALTNNLRTHLLGLHTCLSNLTDTAAFITERYQEEVNV